MTKLSWGESGSRAYLMGVDRGVFYPKNGIGYAWSGLVTVDESAAEANQSLIYVDGVGHQNRLLTGSFAAALSAMTYPLEFEPFDGYSETRSGQKRDVFDLSYRVMQDDEQYVIHLVYNALASPTARNNSSVNTAVDVELFTWDITTVPEIIPEVRSSSHFIVDTKQVNPGVISTLEDYLYGTDTLLPSMPTISDLLAIFEEYAIFRVTDNGDGTATISGPDSAVHMLDATSAEFIWPSVIQISDDTYQLSSL